MYRVNRNRKKWRRKWPLKKHFRAGVDERYCEKCHLPFQDGPLPDPVARFASGNVGALVFPAASFRRELVVSFGRWKAHVRDGFRLSPFVTLEELDDMEQVIRQAREHMLASHRTRSRKKVA